MPAQTLETRRRSDDMTSTAGSSTAGHYATRAALAAALALVLLPPFPVAAQLPQPLSEVELRALLLSRGFTDIESVRFDDGLWAATANAPDGGRAALHVHPNSGAIFLDDANPQLDAAAIEERLAGIGYRDIHAVEFEDGVWKAEAESPDGRELQVFVDPTAGEILAERSD